MPSASAHHQSMCVCASSSGLIWCYTWQVAIKLCSRMHHTAPLPVTCCGSSDLGMQKEFCEFDAVAAVNAGKPVLLTGECQIRPFSSFMHSHLEPFPVTAWPCSSLIFPFYGVSGYLTLSLDMLHICARSMASKPVLPCGPGMQLVGNSLYSSEQPCAVPTDGLGDCLILVSQAKWCFRGCLRTLPH